MKADIQNNEIECPICHRLFEYEDDLTYHYTMIHNPMVFEEE